ncbi:hypothetical protein GCM10009830_00960 [Glycomyces endophyticus]|uniref:Knr4/Smi1-like domain-containing protein n=1 Tax=Glycomyces endophyticus TaxID=480996 RepID=A0ABP4RT90_9ACTN
MDDTVDVRVARAWDRVETALARVLPDSVRLLAPPAEPERIVAVESTLGLRLPPDFRASLLRHDGSLPGTPGPVPLEYLFDTGEIIELTQAWDSDEDPDLDDPAVIARLIDKGVLHVDGPVRPGSSLSDRVVVGTINGDVNWFLDLEPPQGGTSDQVVRVDMECGQWDVLAPSWTDLLHRYAGDLERFADDPGSSSIRIGDGLGPDSLWGTSPEYRTSRPEWLRGVEARDPSTW